MAEERLVYEAEVELYGDVYHVRIFCCEDGRHFAKTDFSDHDIIINDGSTLTEALLKHQSLLPLAVSSRNILRHSSGWTLRDRSSRS